jgi:putative endonuclease
VIDMHCVYVIQNEDGKLYYGYSSNLKERIKGHNADDNIGYTRGSKWKLVYYEAYTEKTDALKREKSLKKSGNARKQLKERIRNSLDSLKSE